MPAPSPFLWILLVFTVWMLSDAIRRRAGWFWYLVILVAPLGPVIYFVLVKLPNIATGRSTPGAMDGRGSSAVPSNRLSSGFLTPSLDHADQLEQAERYDEAVPIYQDALASDPSDLQALHGLARCELGLGHPRVAVSLLEQVLNSNREYRNYGAALDYADALWLAGQKQDALELLEGLVNTTVRVNHRLAYAHYLAQSGDLARAKSEVQRAIDQHTQMSAAEQLRDQRWIERANQMIAEWDANLERMAPPE
jgi:hypothetical protein